MTFAPLSRAILDAALVNASGDSVMLLNRGPQVMQLVLTNLTDFPITFGDAKTPATLQVWFRRGVLKTTDGIELAADGWTLSIPKGDPKTPEVLSPLILTHEGGAELAAGQTLVLTLSGLQPAASGGARNSRVALEYSGVQLHKASHPVGGRRTIHFSMQHETVTSVRPSGFFASSGPLAARMEAKSATLLVAPREGETGTGSQTLRITVLANEDVTLRKTSADAEAQFSVSMQGSDVEIAKIEAEKFELRLPPPSAKDIGAVLNDYGSAFVYLSAVTAWEGGFENMVDWWALGVGPGDSKTDGNDVVAEIINRGVYAPDTVESPELVRANQFIGIADVDCAKDARGYPVEYMALYRPDQLFLPYTGAYPEWSIEFNGPGQALEIAEHEGEVFLSVLADGATLQAGKELFSADLKVSAPKRPGIVPLTVNYKNFAGHDGEVTLLIVATALGITDASENELVLADGMSFASIDVVGKATFGDVTIANNQLIASEVTAKRKVSTAQLKFTDGDAAGLSMTHHSSGLVLEGTLAAADGGIFPGGAVGRSEIGFRAESKGPSSLSFGGPVRVRGKLLADTVDVSGDLHVNQLVTKLAAPSVELLTTRKQARIKLTADDEYARMHIIEAVGDTFNGIEGAKGYLGLTTQDPYEPNETLFDMKPGLSVDGILKAPKLRVGNTSPISAIVVGWIAQTDPGFSSDYWTQGDRKGVVHHIDPSGNYIAVKANDRWYDVKFLLPDYPFVMANAYSTIYLGNALVSVGIERVDSSKERALGGSLDYLRDYDRSYPTFRHTKWIRFVASGEGPVPINFMATWS